MNQASAMPKMQVLSILLLAGLFSANVRVTSGNVQAERDARFEKWLTENGAVLHGVALRDLGTYSRGVIATQDIANGDEIMRIPLYLVVNIEHAMIHPTVGPVLERQVWINDLFAMTIFLYHVYFRNATQRHRESDSKVWGPYFSWLPAKETSPLAAWQGWQEKTRGTSLGWEMRKRRRFNVEFLSRLHRAEPGFADELTLPILEHIIGILQSHSFAVKVLDRRAGEWVGTKGLVPLADALNTDVVGTTTADCMTNSRSTHFICIAKSDISKGTHITTPYNVHSNARLFLDYGFTLDDETFTILDEPFLLNIGSGDDDDSLDPSHLLRLDGSVQSVLQVVERRGLDMKVIRHKLLVAKGILVKYKSSETTCSWHRYAMKVFESELMIIENLLQQVGRLERDGEEM